MAGIEPASQSGRFSYHYSFHYPYGLWSGLYLHHSICLRCLPSSLYTFPYGLRSVLAVKPSPNLTGSTSTISSGALKFFQVCCVYLFHHTRIKLILVPQLGFEPRTPALSRQCSNQLSYYGTTIV